MTQQIVPGMGRFLPRFWTRKLGSQRPKIRQFLTALPIGRLT